MYFHVVLVCQEKLQIQTCGSVQILERAYPSSPQPPEL